MLESRSKIPNISVFEKKPRLWVRVFIIVLLFAFAFIENNPIVRLEALLGLSPSPVERLFGVKSLFSGMTEGVHRLARWELILAFRANPFAILVPPIIVYCCLLWRFPVIDTKKKEKIFFSVFIFLSLLVNLFG